MPTFLARAMLATLCAMAFGANAQSAGPVGDTTDRASEGAKSVELLKQLIAFDTSNAPGDTTRVAQFLKSKFEPLGVSVEIITAPNGKAAHFFARIKGDGSKRPVLLAAHADVVPVDRSKWTVDPFAGIEKDGHVWGRGALDNKGSLAVFARAVMRLVEEKVPLSRDVILLAEADEEQGAFNTTWLAREHWDKMDAEFALNEGGKILVDAQGVTRQVSVSVVDKATINLRLKATGPARHSSMPPPVMETANGQLIAAMAALSNYSGPVKVLPQVEALLRSQARLNPGPMADALKRILSARNDAGRKAGLQALQQANPVETATLGAMLRDTLTITMFSSGTKANVIPGEAEATLNARLLPGSTVENLIQEMQARINNPAVQIELISTLPKAEQAEFFRRRTAIPPSALDTPLYAAIVRRSKETWPQADVVSTLLPAATDATPWRMRGVPVYGLNPYPIRAELALTVHGDDERVPVESIYQATDFIYHVVRDVAARQP